MCTAGCSADFAISSAESGAAAPQDASGTASTGSGTGTGGGGPEVEDDFLALPPAQTDAFVFVANPARDTVTRITVDSLDVITTDVGRDPQIALTTEDFQRAVVFNRGDASISVLQTNSLAQTVVPVRDNLNQMRLSPSGTYAVLWHDIAAQMADDPEPEGLQSFNEASFVDLDTGEHFPMAVGFNPKQVVFTPDETLAAVVSDGTLAVVDLTTRPLLPELIALSDDLVPPIAEEIELSPSGDWAFVRQFGTDEILIVDLVHRTVDAIPVGANPTDMDLTPDGSQAVVMARGSSELWVLDSTNPYAAPQVIPVPPTLSAGAIRIASDGGHALLYTTASLVDRLGVWDLATGAIDEFGLVKPIGAVGIVNNGDSAVVFHTQLDMPDADASDPFFGQWAMTAIDLRDGRETPLLLPSQPLGYSLSDSSKLAYFTMKGEQYLEVIDFDSLLPEQLPLRSDPVFLGVLPDLDPDDGTEPSAWVSQDYELGRISFYDPNSDALETITGFELNSEVE